MSRRSNIYFETITILPHEAEYAFVLFFLDIIICLIVSNYFKKIYTVINYSFRRALHTSDKVRHLVISLSALLISVEKWSALLGTMVN